MFSEDEDLMYPIPSLSHSFTQLNMNKRTKH